MDVIVDNYSYILACVMVFYGTEKLVNLFFSGIEWLGSFLFKKFFKDEV